MQMRQQSGLKDVGWTGSGQDGECSFSPEPGLRAWQSLHTFMEAVEAERPDGVKPKSKGKWWIVWKGE